MAKVKYDVRGVEPGQDFDTPVPPGLYKVKIEECEAGKSKAGNDQLALTLKIMGKKSKGRLLWDYVPLNSEAAEWKLASFIKAVGGKDRGTLDTNKITGSVIQVRTKIDKSEEYGERAKVAALLPLPDEDEDDVDDDDLEDIDVDDEEEDDFDDEDEDEEDDDDEDEDDEEDDDDDDDEGLDAELTWEDIEDMDLDDLKDIIESEELDVRVTKKSKVDTVRERVAEELGIEADEDEEDEDEDDEEEYSDWSVSELKAELSDRGLPTSGKKDKLVSRLEEDDENDDEEPF